MLSVIMLLVTCSSAASKQTLRNVCRHHDETVADRFGRSALLYPSHYGVFQAIRLREKHADAVTVRITRPLDPERDVPTSVSRAARAFERRRKEPTPYEQFSAGTEFPSPRQLRRRRVRFE